jgi:hypothetical protein
VRCPGRTDQLQREWHLARAYETVAAWHTWLGLTEPLDPSVRPYHDRPYQVLRADRHVKALLSGRTDTYLSGLPLLGAVDQYADSTDLLTDRDRTCATANVALAAFPVDAEPNDCACG